MEDGVTLSSVFGKLGVNELDNIVSDWYGEDTWHWGAIDDFFGVIALVDGDYWSRGHLFLKIVLNMNDKLIKEKLLLFLHSNSQLFPHSYFISNS